MKILIKDWIAFLDEVLVNPDDYIDETSIFIGSKEEGEFTDEEPRNLPEDTVVDIQNGLVCINGEYAELVKAVKKFQKSLAYETLLVKIPKGRAKEVRNFVKSLK